MAQEKIDIEFVKFEGTRYYFNKSFPQEKRLQVKQTIKMYKKVKKSFPARTQERVIDQKVENRKKAQQKQRFDQITATLKAHSYVRDVDEVAIFQKKEKPIAA